MRVGYVCDLCGVEKQAWTTGNLYRNPQGSYQNKRQVLMGLGRAGI